jgi:hypothetical protein
MTISEMHMMRKNGDSGIQKSKSSSLPPINPHSNSKRISERVNMESEAGEDYTLDPKVLYEEEKEIKPAELQLKRFLT